MVWKSTKKGPRNRIVYRVPEWAHSYWDERTLKVLCWMDMGKPDDIDIDNIEIEIYDEEEVDLNMP